LNFYIYEFLWSTVIKFQEIVEELIDARHGLLDELFSKFAGPIDVAKSVQGL
jgi:hypothetical protein